MLTFSANLGFLWADLPLPAAIRAAKAAGFDAVECHWPYDTPPEEISAALADTGLPMLGLNTHPGGPADRGLAALVGREADARARIDQAIAYADAIDASAIHVMAGLSEGDAAHATFVENLKYATAQTDRILLIEPINRVDVPGYFLRTTDQAMAVIDAVNAPNLKLMFDCYHVGRTEGDVTTRLKDLQPAIGHIQFAAVPDRGPPDHGELHYPTVFAAIEAMGWTRPLGAEYKTGGPPEESLGWLKSARG